MFIDNRNDQKTDKGNTLVSILPPVILAFIMHLMYCFMKILCIFCLKIHLNYGWMGRVLVSLSQTIKKHGWKALSISFTLFVKVTWNEVQNESSVWDFPSVKLLFLSFVLVFGKMIFGIYMKNVFPKVNSLCQNLKSHEAAADNENVKSWFLLAKIHAKVETIRNFLLMEVSSQITWKLQCLAAASLWVSKNIWTLTLNWSVGISQMWP